MSGPFGSSQWMYASGAEAEGQSLRFNDDDSAYLSWTPASAGNRKTWTWSGWVKRGNIVKSALFTSWTTSGFFMEFSAAHDLDVYDYSGSYQWQLKTSQVFRDASSWYHIVLSFDSTQATAADRVKIYVNGEEVTSFSASTYPSLNYDSYLNQAQEMRLGNGAAVYSDIYLAEVNFVDGTALDPTSFGETDDNGQWVPIIAPSVTYGTNGFYLPFLNGIGDDESGNSNDWTANNIATTDMMLDSPTNNFATFNVLTKGLDATLSEGNLKIAYGTSATRTGTPATIGMTSGKWYWEVLSLSSTTAIIGLSDTTENSKTSSAMGLYPGNTDNGWGYYQSTGVKFHNGTSTAYGASYAVGDIIGVAFDADAGTLTFYKNNTSQGDAFTSLPSATYYPAVGDGGSTTNPSMLANFGQDSSFAGNKTAQGNQDANGKGDFYYEPPAGYLALCTDNLPDPDIADPSEHFNTVLWTGTGGSRSITGVGFQPDFVWTKNRSQGYFHILYDAVRGSGVNKELSSNVTSAEGGSSTNLYGFLSTFGEDGFDTSGGTDGSVPYAYFNQSSDAYVAWNWKADNTSGASNTDGTTTSTVSANTTAGFSIVSYTGTGANATVGHGLSSAPDMIIVKDRDVVRDWVVYHSANTSAPETDYLRLSDTDATADLATAWNDTAPTSNVFSIGTSSGVNLSGSDFIAYCFHSVEGYSKFGSYTGNGSSDGPFVYTGFRPAFVMVKNANNARNWHIKDTERDPYNFMERYLNANDNSAEGSGVASVYVDYLSNGFKLRGTSTTTNENGSNHIYMAFAENPFKYSNAR